MEIDSMYSHVAKWDSRNTARSTYLVEATLMKKMPKFYQHFFSNVLMKIRTQKQLFKQEKKVCTVHII